MRRLFNQQLTEEDERRISSGDIRLLREKLRECDKSVVVILKNNKEDVRYYQGISHMLDELLELLKVSGE